MKNNQVTNDMYGLKAVFSKQDMELVRAYQRIQKFRIKTPSQLAAGWIVNIRNTQSLRNAMVEPMLLIGKPFYSYEPLFGKRSSFDLTVNRKHCDARLYLKDKFSQEFVGTLIDYNQSYKYNSKVKNFCDLLLKADRFQQYCILENNQYTQLNFDNWRTDMRMEKKYDGSFLQDLCN